VLPFGGLTCDVCPYGISNRCRGEQFATAESYLMQGAPVIGCLDATKQSRLYADLHGWRLATPQKLKAEIVIPSFIPEIQRGFKKPITPKRETLFGVSLSTILEDKGYVRYKSAEKLRAELRLPSDARLMLIGAASDYSLEEFWRRSESKELWTHIASLGFELSTSFTYSVWEKNPRFDQIYNQERNFVTHDYLISRGIPSIPFVFFHDKRDYESVVLWLERRNDVRTVAMLAQFYESRSAFQELIEDMRALRRACRRDLGFVVVGPSSTDRIREVLSQFGNASIVTHQPLFKALLGQRVLSDLSCVDAARSTERSLIAVDNLESYRQYCAKFSRRVRKAQVAAKSREHRASSSAPLIKPTI
jgi:hypothetical protein